MSFDKKKKSELIQVAEYFGTEAKMSDNKKAIIAKLVEDGVTFEEAQRLVWNEIPETTAVEPPKDAPVALTEPAPADPGQLVKMTRSNATFQVRGHTFTRQHPYAIVGGPDLDYILGSVRGFRLATPAEVQSYYN